MGDRGSTKSHKVDRASKASTALNDSREYVSDDKNESLLYGKVSKKSVKQNRSIGLINHSLNNEEQSLNQFEVLDVQVDESAFD